MKKMLILVVLTLFAAGPAWAQTVDHEAPNTYPGDTNMPDPTTPKDTRGSYTPKPTDTTDHNTIDNNKPTPVEDFSTRKISDTHLEIK